MTTRLWVPTIERTVALDTSGYETAQPMERHLDSNLDSYSKASDVTLNITLDLDPLGIRTGITWAGVWIHNYNDTAMQTSPYRRVDIWGSDDSAFGAYDDYGFNNLDPAFYLPFYGVLVNGGTVESHRYWRFVCGGATAQQETSLAMLGLHYDVTARWEYGNPDGIVRQYTRGVELPNGRFVKQRMRGVGSRVYQRRYEYLSQSDYEAILNAHQAVGGSAHPFLMQELDEYNKDAVMVRFVDDVLDAYEVTYQLWNVSVTLIEEPYIRDGYLF